MRFGRDTDCRVLRATGEALWTWLGEDVIEITLI